MKFLKLSLLAFVLGTLLLSCSKDNDPVKVPPAPGIEGKWIGAYGFDNETPHVFYSFNIKPGGVIEELNQNGNSKGSGNWTLTGTTFTAHYQWKAPLSTIFTVTATYDEATHKLTGTWGYGDSDDDGGLWELTKQ